MKYVGGKARPEDFTGPWKLYDDGKRWNNRLSPSFYDIVTTNWEMYNGNQWPNASGLSAEFPKPVMNMVKRVVSFFIASMTTTAITANYRTLLMKDDDFEDMETLSAHIASAELKNFFERIKIDMLAKDLLLDAGVSGDMCVHLWFDPLAKPYGDLFDVKGKIDIETIDANNIYFGNPNSRDVQSQPYILIYGRDTVDNIRNEIKLHQKLKSIDEINLAPDNDNEEQASDSGKIEIESDDYGKVGYVLKYCKKRNKQGEERIYVSKSLADRMIYDEIETKQLIYPIGFNNWEHQKNNYHGRALCTDIIPNQIFINRMFAMVMYHLQMTAFPTLLYDADAISGWSNMVGGSVAIEGRSAGESLMNYAQYMQPSVMSPQITQFIDMVIRYTKEMLGANDALLGDINPEQASGAAISVTARQSGVPLDNPKSNLVELIEDISMIYADMMGAYFGTRPVVTEVPTLGKQIIDFDFNKVRMLQFTTTADVGATSYYSQIATQAKLDNMLAGGFIEFIDYLEMMDESDLPGKDKLIAKLKEKAELMAQQASMQPPMGAELPPQLPM